jgi:hypothetical protein
LIFAAASFAFLTSAEAMMNPEEMSNADLRQALKHPDTIPQGPGFFNHFVQTGMNRNNPAVQQLAAQLALSNHPEALMEGFRDFRDRAQRILGGFGDPGLVQQKLGAGPQDPQFWDAVHESLDNPRLQSIESVLAALTSGDQGLEEKARWVLSERSDFVQQLLDPQTLQRSSVVAEAVVAIALGRNYDMSQLAAKLVIDQGVPVQPEIRSNAEAEYIRNHDRARAILGDPTHPLHERAIREWLPVAQFPDLQRLAIDAAQNSGNQELQRRAREVVEQQWMAQFQ